MANQNPTSHSSGISKLAVVFQIYQWYFKFDIPQGEQSKLPWE